MLEHDDFESAAFFTSHCSQVERDLRSGKLRLPHLDGPGRSSHRHGGSWPSHGSGAPSHGRHGASRHASYETSQMRSGEIRSRGDDYSGQTTRYTTRQTPSSGGGAQELYAPVSHQPPSQQTFTSVGAHVQPAGVGYQTSVVPSATAQAPPKHYGLDQVQWGVRIDEFHSLSPFAKYVHPAAALRLQQLWDTGNKLVSYLNATSWEQLAGLDAASSINAVNEVAEAMKTAPDDIGTTNALFLTTAAKFPKRPDAPTAAAIAAVSETPAAAPVPTPMAPQSALAGVQLQTVAQPSAAYQETPQITRPAMVPHVADTVPSIMPGGLPSEPTIKLPGPCGNLSPSLQATIDRILVKWGGLLKLDHFDERVADALSTFPDEDRALQALEEFGENNPSQMRNPTAYLLGCLRRHNSYSRDEYNPDFGGRRGRGRSTRGRGRSGMGVRYEPY